MKNVLVTVFLTFCLAIFCSTGAFAAEVESLKAGHWIGAIEVPGGKLTIVFNVTLENSTYTATCDSPDQGATGLPVESVTVEGKNVRIALPAIGSTFDGVLDSEGNTLSGKWNQSGMAMDCKVTWSATPYSVSRPQNPTAPFPYTVQEVVFENKDAGVVLSGTLTTPEGSGPFPAVVLVAGSGPNDRDEHVFNHKPFLVLSDYLTRKGIIVLRYDKRGIGESRGNYHSATTKDFAADALAALTHLRTIDVVNPLAVGIIGHSEGGIIAPYIAAEHKDLVNFLVLLAAPGVPGRDLLPMQLERILTLSGSPPDQLKMALDQQSTLFKIVLEEADPDKASVRLTEEMKRRHSQLDSEQKNMPGMSEGEMITSAQAVNSPWFRCFLSMDPKTSLQKTTCPVLALWGDKDIQVVPEQNRPRVESALTEAGNTNVTMKVFPGLNHLFQTAETGLISEYGSLSETISPAVLDYIGEWISKQVK